MITPRSGGFPFIFRKETDRRKPSVVSIHHSANHQEAGKHNGNYKKEIKVFQIIGWGCFSSTEWTGGLQDHLLCLCLLTGDRWPPPLAKETLENPFSGNQSIYAFFCPAPPIFTLAPSRPVGMLRPVHPWCYPCYPNYTFTLKLQALSLMIYHVAPLWKTSITSKSFEVI